MTRFRNAVGGFVESWVDVLGFENFFSVSNFGNVKSKRTGKVLKQNTSKKGYKTISTKIGGRQGVNVCFRVHRLVCIAFNGFPDPALEVNHKNLDKTDNRAVNLEWVTPKMNIAHARENERHFSPKKPKVLSVEDECFIRSVYKPRDLCFGCRALARKFNVSHKTIQNILTR